MHGDKKRLINCDQFSGGNLERSVNVGKSEVVLKDKAIVNFFIERTWPNERKRFFQSVSGSLQITARLVDLCKYAVSDELRTAEAVAFRIGSNLSLKWKRFISTAYFYE